MAPQFHDPRFSRSAVMITLILEYVMPCHVNLRSILTDRKMFYHYSRPPTRRYGSGTDHSQNITDSTPQQNRNHHHDQLQYQDQQKYHLDLQPEESQLFTSNSKMLDERKKEIWSSTAPNTISSYGNYSSILKPDGTDDINTTTVIPSLRQRNWPEL